MTRAPRHAIGLVGCGAIGRLEAGAYRAAGWDVTAVCDIDPVAANSLADEFFPDAVITTSLDELLALEQVMVIDLAVHTDVRPAMIRKAIEAGKHILSQKPFIDDVAEGEALALEAERAGVVLAVNQNGRFAPHFAAMLRIVESGRIGRIVSADFAAYWAHDLHAEHHPLGGMRHLVLHDFAIHWFDLVNCLMGRRPARSVYAIAASRDGQRVPGPTLASALIDYVDAQVTILMRASARHEDVGTFHIQGTEGSISHRGTALGGGELSVVTAAGVETQSVEGSWFPDALIGSMNELCSALEERRPPTTSPPSSLEGLVLCFAAIESAERGIPIDPAGVRALPAAATAVHEAQ